MGITNLKNSLSVGYLYIAIAWYYEMYWISAEQYKELMFFFRKLLFICAR